MRFAEAINNDQLEEIFAQSNYMLSSAAEDRNEHDPEEFVPPNEYDFDPYEIEKMNKEYQNKEPDTNYDFEKSPDGKQSMFSA